MTKEEKSKIKESPLGNNSGSSCEMLELNKNIWLDEGTPLLILQFPGKIAKHPHHHLKQIKRIELCAVKELGS